jgi:hypothetical protein
MGGRKLSGVPHGRRRRASSVCCVGKRSLWWRVSSGSLPPVSLPGVRHASTRAEQRGKNSRSLAVLTPSPGCAQNWANRPWQWRGYRQREAGANLSALSGPGGRDAEPGSLALPRAALWPGACGPCVGPRPLPPLRAATRVRGASCPPWARGAWDG